MNITSWAKIKKLAPKWTGPHKILRLKGDSNLELQLRHNNRKTIVHANRLKPYFVASNNAAVFPDSLQAAPLSTPAQLPADDQSFPEPENYLDTIGPLLPFSTEVTQPSPAIKAQPRTHSSSSTFSETFNPPTSHTRSKVVQQNVTVPNKPTLVFPQLTSDPLPLFQSREGLENENDQQEIAINFVDNNNSWTLVKKKETQAKC
jgi:hypothetical protein